MCGKKPRNWAVGTHSLCIIGRAKFLFWNENCYRLLPSHERFVSSGVYCIAVWVVVGDMVDHEELAACSAEC